MIWMFVFSRWVMLEQSSSVRHTIASLRAAVIAEAFLILSNARLEGSCIGEVGINILGKNLERKSRLQHSMCLKPGRAD